jgi:cytochrome c
VALAWVALVLAGCAGPQALDGETLFMACAGCHSLAPGAAHGVGPNLHALEGRTAGSREDFAYSPALSNSAMSWNRDSLRAWINTAETMVPGTWMLYHNHLQAEEVDRLADYILQAH